MAKDAPKTARDLVASQAALKALQDTVDRPINVHVAAPNPVKAKNTYVKLNPLRLLALAAYGSVGKHLDSQAPYAHIRKILGDSVGYSMALRSAAEIATTTSSGWGAELVQSMTMDFLQELQSTNVASQLMLRSGVIPFDGANSLTWPFRADSAAGSMRPSWIGEGASIPVLQSNLSSTTLTRHKLGCIAVVTNELVTVSCPGVLKLLEDFIRDDLSAGLDYFMFDPTVTGVTAIRPASITNGANTQASAGDSLANVLTDLKWLRTQMSAVNSRDTVFLMHSDRLMGLQMLQGAQDDFPLRSELERTGGLFGVPILHSPHFPSDICVAMDTSKFAAVMDGIHVDSSSAATLAMADDDGVAPTMLDTDAVNDVGGSIHISDAAGTTPPTVVRSMFQTDSTAIRLVAPLTYRMIKPSVSYLSGVTW